MTATDSKPPAETDCRISHPGAWYSFHTSAMGMPWKWLKPSTAEKSVRYQFLPSYSCMSLPSSMGSCMWPKTLSERQTALNSEGARRCETTFTLRLLYNAPTSALSSWYAVVKRAACIAPSHVKAEDVSLVPHAPLHGRFVAEVVRVPPANPVGPTRDEYEDAALAKLCQMTQVPGLEAKRLDWRLALETQVLLHTALELAVVVVLVEFLHRGRAIPPLALVESFLLARGSPHVLARLAVAKVVRHPVRHLPNHAIGNLGA
eukprot:scaffold140188_cov33-Prasinocladus_malaysianus.AAC.1